MAPGAPAAIPAVLQQAGLHPVRPPGAGPGAASPPGRSGVQPGPDLARPGEAAPEAGPAMRIEVRPVARLRADPAATTAAIADVLRAARRRARRPGRAARGLRLDPVQLQLPRGRRPAPDPGRAAPPGRPRPRPKSACELAVDLRRAAGSDLGAQVRALLAARDRELTAGAGAAPRRCRWNRGGRGRPAASGASTRCTGRPCRTGSSSPAASTSARCPAGQATPATPPRSATSSWSCSRSGTTWTRAARCPPSCTWSSSASATAGRPGPGWMSSWPCPGRTAATTTAACTT